MGGEQVLTEGDPHALERLQPEHVRAGGLLAASHLHRYELAAELCRGRRVLDLCCGTGYGSLAIAGAATSVHGVDVADDAVAIARAEARRAELENATFETGDALEFLRALDTGSYDAIVCYEGIEHVPDPDAVLAELARQVDGGARLILSFPNSRGFAEENEFHVTDYGWEEMTAAIARFDGAIVLTQHLAETSLIRPVDADPDVQLHGVLVGHNERADAAAWANHWIVLAGVDDEQARAATARLEIATGDPHYGYMRRLERANRELRLANARMARAWLGVHDAAAATVIRRLEQRAEQADELRKRLELEIEVARHNDELYQAARAKLDETHHRLIEGLYRRVRRLRG